MFLLLFILQEVGSLEQMKAELQAEINRLLRTSEELETRLSEHKLVCQDPKLKQDPSNSPSNSPDVSCNEIISIAHKDPSNRVYSSPSNLSSTNPAMNSTTRPSVIFLATKSAKNQEWVPTTILSMASATFPAPVTAMDSETGPTTSLTVIPAVVLPWPQQQS